MEQRVFSLPPIQGGVNSLSSPRKWVMPALESVKYSILRLSCCAAACCRSMLSVTSKSYAVESVPACCRKYKKCPLLLTNSASRSSPSFSDARNEPSPEVRASSCPSAVSGPGSFGRCWMSSSTEKYRGLRGALMGLLSDGAGDGECACLLGLAFGDILSDRKYAADASFSKTSTSPPPPFGDRPRTGDRERERAPSLNGLSGDVG